MSLVVLRRVPAVVLGLPLRALLVPFNLGGVDKAITNSPFWRSRMGLIVSNGLNDLDVRHGVLLDPRIRAQLVCRNCGHGLRESDG